MSRRLDRVNESIRRDLSSLISEEINDPRIQSHLCSVTRVSTSKNLRIAQVYVSVMGNTKDNATVLDGLNAASTFMSRRLSELMSMKYTPKLFFILDNSTEESVQISKLINDIHLP